MADKKQAIRVYIVDDHPIVRKGLSLLINQEPDMTVCGESEDAHNAMKQIPNLKPDVVVVDISLKDMNGLELIRILRTRHVKLPIIVLSMHEESLFAERALRAGAKGYLMKQEGTEKVVQAIKKVLTGEYYVSESVSTNVLSRFSEGDIRPEKSPLERLSDRELEVFQLIGQGMGTREIAEKLCLSVKTVESHREHIKQKLSLRNSVELVQQAAHFFRNQAIL